MLVYWRPDLKMYRAVITEEAAADAPFDPPFISDSQTPTGCFVKPAPDASLQFAGQIHVSMTLDVPNLNISNQACNGFGSYILNPSQFGWVLTFKDTGAGIAPVVTDNATGLTNQMQVRADACSATLKGFALENCLTLQILQGLHAAPSIQQASLLQDKPHVPCALHCMSRMHSVQWLPSS